MLRHYQSWLKQIEDALRTGAAVVNQPDVSQGVALHGQGGLGKTAMAVAYAYEYQDRYPGGVFWVQADLGLGQALAEIATNLGCRCPPKPRTSRSSIRCCRSCARRTPSWSSWTT